VSGADGLDLTGAEADELLRPVAELAIEVARAGSRLQPPLEVPKGLGPLVGHAKVTRAALAKARRALESDAVFRARVEAVVPGIEEALGRAGVVWLTRPEGWEAELGELLSEARAAAATKEDTRSSAAPSVVSAMRRRHGSGPNERPRMPTGASTRLGWSCRRSGACGGRRRRRQPERSDTRPRWTSSWPVPAAGPTAQLVSSHPPRLRCRRRLRPRPLT